MTLKKDFRDVFSAWVSLLALTLALLAPLDHAAAQQQRDRRAIPVAAPTSSVAPTPTPEASRSIKASANAPATLADLQARIQQIANQPALESGFFAVKIVSLDNGSVIYEQDAHKFVRPASNMKIYTVATAFDRLTPDYRFITSVYAQERPDDGKIKGDLTVYGRGDPSIAARFNGGDYFKGINDLADRIVAAGVKRIKGDLVGDESYFNGAPLGSGWEWDDLTWSYGAQVSALTINDNAVDLTIKPGDKVGAPVVITSGPPATGFMAISNRATTSARGSKNELQLYRAVGQNTLEVTGTLPLGDAGFNGGVAIPDPALAFVSMLRDALIKRGVKIDGRLRTVRTQTSESKPMLEITSLQSPPFSLIAAHTMKPSQNQYTELILRTLGKTRSTSGQASATSAPQDNENAGLAVLRDFLHQAGVSDSDLVLSDGSGLSRNDMITANATVELLTFMSKHKYSAQFRDTLPIAGVDGTLRSRMRGTPAEGNVRAKTGSLSSVASLSGYVTTAAGEHLVFSMMLNNYPDAAALRRDSIDAIAILLASFAGKTQ